MMYGFLRQNWLSLLAGFVAGLYHVVVYVFLAVGVGHGAHAGSSLIYLFFGYGSFLWFLLPPFQYAYYAYIARHRLKRLASINALVHYGSAAGLMVWAGSWELLLPEPASSSVWTNVLTFLLFFGPFTALNIYFFRRVFGK